MCSQAPPSGQAQPAAMSNAFALRQMNANETRSVQPPYPQHNPDSVAHTPIIPSADAYQPPIIKAPHPPLARISSEAANRPFLTRTPPTPISPSSSTRSASSGGSRPPRKPRSAATSGTRIFDPRPPSQELSANMDCAFPAFPMAPASPKKPGRNTSSGSGASRDKSRSKSHHRSDTKSSGHGTSRVASSRSNSSRSGTRRSATSDGSSRRSSNETRLQQDIGVTELRASPQAGPLTPVEEDPITSSPWSRPPVSEPEISDPVPPSPRFLSSAPTSAPAAESDVIASTTVHQRNVSQDTEFSSRSKGSTSLRSISGNIRSVLTRKASNEKLGRQKSDASGGALPVMPVITSPVQETQLAEQRIPPQRPPRPDEGLPADLLNPMNTRISRTNVPAPLRLDRLHYTNSEQRSAPLPPDTEPTSSPKKLLKMPSESTLRSTPYAIDMSSSGAAPSCDSGLNGSQLDLRIQEALRRPKGGESQAFFPFHRASTSVDSSTSSIVSLSNLSIGNSHSTTGTSPMASATSSVDAYSHWNGIPDRSSQDDDLRVAALSIRSPTKRQAIYEQHVEAAHARDDRHASAEEYNSGIVAERRESLDEAPLPMLSEISRTVESPLDPALYEGRLLSDETSDPVSRSDAAWSQQNLEGRHGEASEGAPAPFTHTETTQVAASQHKAQPSAASDFEGFNFGGFTNSPADSPVSIVPPVEISVQSPVDTPTQSTFDIPARSTVALSPRSDGTSSNGEPSPTWNELQTIPAGAKADDHVLRKPRNRSTTGTKPTCRGCGYRIEGKSIKAADGRLTGRWHKSCFVCQACTLPFETSDFYVFDDRPYCEQHYHEHNDSICHGCHTGIEGEFLETKSGPGGNSVHKYHRRCLTCVDCRMPLTEDYFEVEGRMHCERHAFAAMRSVAQRASGNAYGYSKPGSHLRAESTMTLWPNPLQA